MTVLGRRLAEPFYHERGEVACLLLHGFAGSPAEVRPLGEALAARGITVQAPLLPGHGTQPDDLRNIRWPQWVRAAEAELAAMQERYGRVHVAGFSMGGALSLYLAAHHNVASVCTLAAPVRLADWRQVLVPFAKFLIADYPARVSNPEIAAQLDSYDRFPVPAIQSLIHLVKLARRDLGRVSAPLLALQGDRDRWIDPRSGEYILANIRSAEKELVYLAGRGHMITLEHGREEVFRLVCEWIERHG